MIGTLRASALRGLLLSLLLGAGMFRPVEAQLIVAHRGASADAPENTLAAFNLAWQQGADAIEADFYLTRDGHIVAIHDDNTKKVAGVDLRVAESTLRQLRKLDVGTWKSPRFSAERIPTFDEVLASVPKGKKIFIEIKCGPEIVPKLKDALAASPLKADQTVVITFNEKVVVAIKKQIPAIKVHWLTGYKKDKKTNVWSPSRKKVLSTLRRIDADGLDTQANRTMVDREMVQRLRSEGYQFHTWTINEPADAVYFQGLGVDSITTDHPAKIRRALASTNPRNTNEK